MGTALPVLCGHPNRLKPHRLPGSPLSVYEQQAIRPMNHVIVILFVSLKSFFISTNQKIKSILLHLPPPSSFQFPVVSCWAGLFEIWYKTPEKSYNFQICVWVMCVVNVKYQQFGCLRCDSFFYINLQGLKQAQVSRRNMYHWWPDPRLPKEIREGVRQENQALMWKLSLLNVYCCGSLSTRPWERGLQGNHLASKSPKRRCSFSQRIGHGLVSDPQSCRLKPDFTSTQRCILLLGQTQTNQDHEVDV